MPSFPPVRQSKLIKALRRLGYTVDESKGKGSHAKFYGFDGRSMTIPASLESPSTRGKIAQYLIAQGTNMEELAKEL